MFHYDNMSFETREAYTILDNTEKVYNELRKTTHQAAIQLENAKTDDNYVAARRVFIKRLRGLYSECEFNFANSPLIVWQQVADNFLSDYYSDPTAYDHLR